MREITIGAADGNQRLDKYLMKLLNKAGKTYVYTMLRKKRIKLNGKKTEGSELLSEGDRLSLFIYEEELAGLMSAKTVRASKAAETVYEDEHILIAVKPAGVLSHADSADSSDTMTDRILRHLIEKGEYTPSPDSAFTPALANRLDRNTGGLVLCGKTLAGLTTLNHIIHDKLLEKRYYALCEGLIDKPLVVDFSLKKHEKTNTVGVDSEGKAALTEIYPVWTANNRTLVDVCLITGRTHQIRAHLSAIGHPIAGDTKYGGKPYERLSRAEERYLLFAYKIGFCRASGVLSYLNGKVFEAPLPKWAKKP